MGGGGGNRELQKREIVLKIVEEGGDYHLNAGRIYTPDILLTHLLFIVFIMQRLSRKHKFYSQHTYSNLSSLFLHYFN